MSKYRFQSTLVHAHLCIRRAMVFSSFGQGDAAGRQGCLMDRRGLAQIARLYYQEGLSQAEIAECIGLSRSQVSRLLAEAERVGVVRIYIEEVDERDRDLEQALEENLGLVDAVVVHRLGSHDRAVRTLLGRAAAGYLAETLANGDIVGVTSGYTLREVIRFLKRPQARELKVVQLMGGEGATALQSYPEALARDCAQALGAILLSLHAPLVVENSAVRDVILSTASVRAVVAMWERLTVVLMGVGDVSPEGSLFKAGWFTSDDVRALLDAGAVGVVCGQFFDEQGRRVASPTDERIIATPLGLFRKVPRTIAVAGGSTKAAALLGAIRGGYCNTVITDDHTAREVLARALSQQEGGSVISSGT